MPLSGFHSHERKVHLQRDEEANLGELPCARAMRRLAAFLSADLSWLNLGVAATSIFLKPRSTLGESTATESAYASGNVGSGSHQNSVAVITTIQATKQNVVHLLSTYCVPGQVLTLNMSYWFGYNGMCSLMSITSLFKETES